MSFIPVMKYIVGIGLFGFVYWILNGIMDEFIAAGVSKTGTTYELALYLWAGILIIYLIFGGYWVIRTYNEEHYMRNGGML